MEAEAAPLIERLELTKDDPQPIKPPAPAVSFSGNHFGIAIHVVHNGDSRPREMSARLKYMKPPCIWERVCSTVLTFLESALRK